MILTSRRLINYAANFGGIFYAAIGVAMIAQKLSHINGTSAISVWSDNRK